MPIYHYKATNRISQPVQGRIEAETPEAATELLAEKGQFVNEITPAAKAAPDSYNNVSSSFRKTSKKLKLTERERFEFIRQVTTALEAKLPILTVLQVVGQQNPHPAIKQMTAELTETIRAGKSLSYALSQYPRSFDRLHLSMVAVGEASGSLERSMSQLTELTERDLEIRSEITTAAMYPIFVLSLGLISVVIVVTWILPQILKTLVTDQSVLPWPTRVILEISYFFKNPYGWLLIISLIIIALGLSRWKKTAIGRYIWGALKLKTPVLGPVISKWSISRFARTLGTLTAGGVNILDALQIVRNCMGNEVLARELDRVTGQVRTGSSLAGPLRESGRFPPLLVQIVSMGEETGQMAELLLNAADAFDKDTSEAVKRFMAIFPAVLITILALVVGFIIAATLLPIMQIETAIPGF